MLENGIEIFNKIGFKYYKKTSGCKNTEEFTPEHVRYECRITVDGISMEVPYYCNPEYSKPNKLDVLSCICLDYDSYMTNQNNIGGFLCELGYNSSPEALNRGIKIFDALKDHCRRMDKLFSKDEINDLLECVSALENNELSLNDDGETVAEYETEEEADI